MGLNLNNSRHSFPARLTSYIFVVVASVFILALVFFTRWSSENIRNEAMEYAKVTLSRTVGEVEALLIATEMVAENMGGVVPHALQEGRSLQGLPQMVLENNPYLWGCALTFISDVGTAHQGISPYAYREGDSIRTQVRHFESSAHEPWLAQVLAEKKACWSRPYAENFGVQHHRVTYSYPLTDENGKIYAFFTLDLSLPRLEKRVHQMNPFAKSHSLILEQHGDYVVRPNDFVVEKKNLFSSAENKDNETLRRLGEDMVAGREGAIEIERAGDPYLIFYAPLRTVNWSVAVGCREHDLFVDLYRMIGYISIVAFLGLLLLVLLCYYVIRKMTRPLVQLAGAAEHIANGHFSEKLPVVRGRDEMSALRRSFAVMQRSLVKYMEDLKESIRLRERVESDLRIAGEIQQLMVPTHFPTYPAYEKIDVDARLVPAKMVGGDFYHFLIEGDYFYFIIGDVAGKGVPAALMMSAVCCLFRTVAVHVQRPAKMMEVLNDALVENNEINLFVTAFFGRLQLSTGRLDYCNAGHNAAVVMSPQEGASWMVVKPNLPLGVLGDFSYEEQSMRLSPGTALLLYTDGVTEAENASHQLFSEQRLLDFASRVGQQTAHEVLEQLYQAVQAHAGVAAQSDDITMMCINYEPKEKAAYGESALSQQ